MRGRVRSVRNLTGAPVTQFSRLFPNHDQNLMQFVSSVGQLIVGAGFQQKVLPGVKQVVADSITHDFKSPLNGKCEDLPPDGIVRVSTGAMKCNDDGLTDRLLGPLLEKWNTIFEDFGLPVRFEQTGKNSTSTYFETQACAYGINPAKDQSNLEAALTRTVGLVCPPTKGPLVHPSLERALSSEDKNFAYTLNSFSHGEWRTAGCGAPLPGPTDVAALGTQCQPTKSDTYLSAVTQRLSDHEAVKFGSNAVGHFFGTFAADLVRRIVEITMIRCGEFQDRQHLVKLVSEAAASATAAAIMSYCGSYTAYGGAFVWGCGFCVGTLAEMVLPESLRAVLTTLGPVNIGFAMFDGLVGSGNPESELIATYLGHAFAQLALAAVEARVLE